MNIEKITILSGIDKKHNPENFEAIEIFKGEKIGIVGPTGSGKSQLLYDIDKLANGETKTKRKILINDTKAELSLKTDPSKKIIGYLTQHMNFMTDISVYEFLTLHIKIREKTENLQDSEELIENIIKSANTITGEKIKKEHNLLSLSGGQSRALMVSDLAYVSESPIVLIDEIENAGIKIENALNLLVKSGKIIFLVTHDPMLSLSTDKRIIMKNGAISKIIQTSEAEKQMCKQLSKISTSIFQIRDTIREGELLEYKDVLRGLK